MASLRRSIGKRCVRMGASWMRPLLIRSTARWCVSGLMIEPTIVSSSGRHPRAERMRRAGFRDAEEQDSRAALGGGEGLRGGDGVADALDDDVHAVHTGQRADARGQILVDRVNRGVRAQLQADLPAGLAPARSAAPATRRTASPAAPQQSGCTRRPMTSTVSPVRICARSMPWRQQASGSAMAPYSSGSSGSSRKHCASGA